MPTDDAKTIAEVRAEIEAMKRQIEAIEKIVKAIEQKRKDEK
jgi:hypothetical protein